MNLRDLRPGEHQEAGGDGHPGPPTGAPGRLRHRQWLQSGPERERRVASGLNPKRRGLAKLIKAAQDGTIATVVIEYPDRLSRFGYEYLERLFGVLGVSLVVMDAHGVDTGDFERELVTDLLAVVSSSAARVYGAQGGLKVRQQVSSVLAEVASGG